VEERKINPENIYYIADNELEYLSAVKIFKVQSYKLSDFSVPALKNLITGIDMKFDVVFSNPPYTNNVDIKILNELLPISEQIIAIHPSTWLIDCKYGTKFTVDFRNNISKSLSSIEMFNGNPIFNIGLYVPTVITHINSKHNGSIQVNFFNDSFEIENIFDISKYGVKEVLI
jgi:predicted RNA methylase